MNSNDKKSKIAFTGKDASNDAAKENIEKLYARFLKLKERRSAWESLWAECYEYALPQKEGFFGTDTGIKKGETLFDATAADAVDQLAASLFAELTPPWSRWFGLGAGIDSKDYEDEIADKLASATEVLRHHFDRSNFAIEIHQCYLDLITVGTASLLFEEAKIGESSAFRFTAIPLSEVYVDESGSGRLDTTFRCSFVSYEVLRTRFPEAILDESFVRRAKSDSEIKIKVVEAVTPKEAGGYDYIAFIAEDSLGSYGSTQRPVLKQGVFVSSPFINFRWQKVPSEIYGRSPIMKALPDIKTANKVVELILKNASIAVTGIWQAEDDGVLNPANIKLVPGAIIPKAVGSKGLVPLQTAGNFDVSQIILSDLRMRIKHALLNDKLGQIGAPSMTATEVLERSSEMARILGATYGRLQSELLTPLITRALSILIRRGEISALYLDGHFTRLEYASPLARRQAQADAANTLSWLASVSKMGAAGIAAVNMPAAALWLGKTLGVPSELMKSEAETQTLGALASAAKSVVSALKTTKSGDENDRI